MKKSVSKKQIAFILVAVCLVWLIGIGVSYSYFLANISTSKEENKNSNISTTTITQVVMDMQGKISSDGAYPGHKMVKEVVVRGIGADDATPANASIQITPDLGDFKDDVTWKLYKSDSPITCTSTKHVDGGQFYEDASCDIPSRATLELQGSSDSDYLNIVVNPNTETKYYLVVEYANSEDQSSQMGKSFSIDIGLGEKQFTPLEKIIASVDTTGKCPTINSDGTVKVTKIEATDGYVCSAADAYGTSYYYRGNVTNNYVKFADKYWRIIRINGDGTVRVIYDGTSAHANGESSTDRQIGTSRFNSSYNDNAYVGYMYGTVGASTYAETHTNTNNSTIKTYIDTWYENNIKGTANEKYIVDNLFCNDRSLALNSSGTGSGNSSTYYRWHNFANNSNNNKMMLTCPQQNDAFTVSDTSKGNGALTYGIGLVTTDEVVLGGSWSSGNYNYYLYTGQSYWTSSPSYFSGYGATMHLVDFGGYVDYTNRVTGTGGARPVISLSSEVLVHGDGTMNNPYRLTENIDSTTSSGSGSGASSGEENSGSSSGGTKYPGGTL